MKQPISQRILSNYTVYFYDIIRQFAEEKEIRDTQAIRDRITKTNELNKTLKILYGQIPFSSFKKMLIDYQDNLKRYTLNE